MTRASRRTEEQRSFPDQEQRVGADRSDPPTAAPSGDADVRSETGGWFGEFRQSLTNHWKVRHR